MSQCKAGCKIVLEDQDVQLDNELCNTCYVASMDAAEEGFPFLNTKHPLTGEPFDDDFDKEC